MVYSGTEGEEMFVWLPSPTGAVAGSVGVGEVEPFMAYSWEFANTAAGKVLKAIQMRGEASIKDVAADLGVTTSAVRLHLAQLQAAGCVPHICARQSPNCQDFTLWNPIPDIIFQAFKPL